MFKIGQVVQHIINGNEYLLVLEKGREQVKCRTQNFQEIWFYEWELKEPMKYEMRKL